MWSVMALPHIKGETLLESLLRQPPVKRIKRSTKQLQERLLQLCKDRKDGIKFIEDTLRGLGHNIRF